MTVNVLKVRVVEWKRNKQQEGIGAGRRAPKSGRSGTTTAPIDAPIEAPDCPQSPPHNAPPPAPNHAPQHTPRPDVAAPPPRARRLHTPSMRPAATAIFIRCRNTLTGSGSCTSAAKCPKRSSSSLLEPCIGAQKGVLLLLEAGKSPLLEVEGRFVLKLCGSAVEVQGRRVSVVAAAMV